MPKGMATNPGKVDVINVLGGWRAKQPYLSRMRNLHTIFIPYRVLYLYIPFRIYASK